MTPEQAKALREPFPPEFVGKLPRVWCGACREARYKVCDKHTKRRCSGCGNNITDAHLHLDYVGHAEITDRLLAVDPGWSWEPVAFDAATGLPMLDRNGGLWIRLTVSGVTRLGYGHADGKTGPDAVKESIGDALRNAAMRFGVALDLWGAKFKNDDAEHDAPAGGASASAGPSMRARALFDTISSARTVAALKDAYDEIGPALEAGEITKQEADQLADHVRNLKDKIAETRVGTEAA